LIDIMISFLCGGRSVVNDVRAALVWYDT